MIWCGVLTNRTVDGGIALMFSSNPFAELSKVLSPETMQAFVVVMILLVVLGTLFDIMHKGSAKYFFANWNKARKSGKRELASGEMLSVAGQTVVHDVLMSGEFCNPKRRMAHLFTMYGFLLYAIMTAIMVFWYPTPDAATPSILPFLWHLGALMVCIGGYWFWFFIRADVSAEGQSPFRLMRADLFVLSLLASTTLALIWSYLQHNDSSWTIAALVLYLLATIVLFGSVPWSKFSHMFFKPAAAFQKRVAKTDGSLDMLPAVADRTDPADRDRHSMELLKDASMNMGLGIKREAPRHY
jgi:predicted small integral membrane protein